MPQPPPAPGVDAFAALTAPGYAKAAMNFRWTEDGDGWVRLSTSTRVVATSPGARRRFAAYWRLIYPGSAFLRRTWLAAIRRRSERADARRLPRGKSSSGAQRVSASTQGGRASRISRRTGSPGLFMRRWSRLPELSRMSVS